MRTDPTTQRDEEGEDGTGAWRSELVDLSDLSLVELEQLPSNALTGSLRRILAESVGRPHIYGQYYASSI